MMPRIAGRGRNIMNFTMSPTAHHIHTCARSTRRHTQVMAEHPTLGLCSAGFAGWDSDTSGPGPAGPPLKFGHATIRASTYRLYCINHMVIAASVVIPVENVELNVQTRVFQSPVDVHFVAARRVCGNYLQAMDNLACASLKHNPKNGPHSESDCRDSSAR